MAKTRKPRRLTEEVRVTVPDEDEPEPPMTQASMPTDSNDPGYESDVDDDYFDINDEVLHEAFLFLCTGLEIPDTEVLHMFECFKCALDKVIADRKEANDQGDK